jgi:hypothetical protein
MNWYGLLDDRTRSFIDAIENEPWAATLRTLDALNRDDLSDARADVGGATLDSQWAREIQAQAIARLDGVSAAEPLFRSLLEESVKEPPDYVIAADAALVLRDAAAARRYIEEGVSAKRVSASLARLNYAIIDLFLEREPTLNPIREQIAGAAEPSLFRELAYRAFPILAAAWAENAGVVRALQTLQQEAEARTKENPPLPPLTFELDHSIRGSSDRELDDTVRELLQIEEEGGLTGPSTVERLERLELVVANIA